MTGCRGSKAPVALQKSDLTGAADVLPVTLVHHSQPQEPKIVEQVPQPVSGEKRPIAEKHSIEAEIVGECEVETSHTKSVEERVAADVLPERQAQHSWPQEPKVIELEHRVSEERT
eukprot:TRINITY_DN66842_c0_g1_i1.p1 TRINITY_DN66842_c0_g1~~TRINITY_DN66842_c0_g1_i1.p1  ORF type:complete len:116 (+),score=26.69 TRINITY_DN66842_c0_g1_i1:41-388(+)